MKKFIAVLLSILVVMSFTVGFLYVEYDKTVNKDTIYNGISINDVDVSGLTKSEALEKLKNTDPYGDNTVELVYGDYDFNYNFKDLGYNPDYEYAVNEAYQIGREGNPVDRYKEIIELKTSPKKIMVDKSLKEENINNIISYLNEVISKPAVDAKLNVDHGNRTITPEEIGYSVDNEAIKSKLMHVLPNSSPITIPVHEIQANLVASQYDTIEDNVGTYSTNYSTSISGRKHNIKLSSEIINDTVVMPGEEFSFNKTIGEISIKSGFKEATVIINGEFDQGVGGGVCQVSTTLYNALLQAGVQIVERHPHSKPVHYVPEGKDAAVAIGVKDLRFKNNYSLPIIIESTADGNNITFSIIADRESKI